METRIFLLTLVTFILNSLPVFVNGELFMSAESSTVSEGTQATISCYSGSLSDPDIFNQGGYLEWGRYTQYSAEYEMVAKWTKTAKEIKLSDAEDAARFSLDGGLTGDRFTQSLIIRNTAKTDQGQYLCTLHNGSGTKVDEVDESSRLSLTVKYPPADYYPMCSATPDVGQDSITLKCESEKTTPLVTLQWYKDDVKVADGHTLDLLTESTYDARSNELDSEFECRLVYDDGAGVEVRRSCQFRRPYVAILRLGGDNPSGETVYHALSHSSPPFVSNILCSLESSTSTTIEFENEFPGYGRATVGPVATADNGTKLVCQATNVFGSGKAEMPMWVYSDQSSGRVSTPSVVTNVTPQEALGRLTATVWPETARVAPGQNATFGCSYSLAMPSSSRAAVDVTWKYNNDPIDTSSNDRFVTEGNYLHMSDVSDGDNSATITCAVSVNDDANVVSIPDSEATSNLIVDAEAEASCQSCQATLVQESGQESILQNTTFIIGIFVLAGIGWLLVIALIFVVVTQTKKQNRTRLASNSSSISSQVTFRAGNNSQSNGNANNQQAAHPAARALPAHPTAPVAPATDASDTTSKPKSGLHVVMPMEVAKPELAYQEMVGNTGVTKTRHGNSAKANGPNGVPDNVGNGHAAGGSIRAPAVMVPAPNGGFVPHTMMSNGYVVDEKSAGNGEEINYEDLDCMRQQHARRAQSNDYQTSISNTPCPQEDQELLAHYANS